MHTNQLMLTHFEIGQYGVITQFVAKNSDLAPARAFKSQHNVSQAAIILLHRTGTVLMGGHRSVTGSKLQSGDTGVLPAALQGEVPCMGSPHIYKVHAVCTCPAYNVSDTDPQTVHANFLPGKRSRVILDELAPYQHPPDFRPARTHTLSARTSAARSASTQTKPGAGARTCRRRSRRAWHPAAGGRSGNCARCTLL